MPETGVMTLLGTGGSAGVPMIGCHCPTCTSPSPYNKRFRPAALLRIAGKTLLLDAGPDVRDQLLREKVDSIDGLLLTHPHYDHIGGIDELRVFYFQTGRPVPCILSKTTYSELKERYSYLFKKGRSANLAARFDFEVIESGADVSFLGLDFSTLLFYQGGMEVTGYRFGDLAYVSDICDFVPELFDRLKGVKTLIVSALRESDSHVHFNVAQAIEFAERVGADQTYFTHIAHELSHERAAELAPEGIDPGYDGLQIEFKL
jgi:phosphoribosyl 1,2-cyclic phosphate phosphodiesterase